MVLPIVIGVGVTVVALGLKLTLSAYRKYAHLTPQMIASLNYIRLVNESNTHVTLNSHIRFLIDNYPNAPFMTPMTEQEALKILGIGSDEILNFNRDILKKRYRDLIILNHPDRNGSQYLTQKLNQAKEVLEKSYMINR